MGKHIGFQIPIGMILAIIIFIYTIMVDLWSKLDSTASFLLGLALIVLFCVGFEFQFVFKEEKKEEKRKHE